MTPPHAPTASFYHLGQARLDRSLCQGLACFVARAQNPQRWQQAAAQDARVYCLGKCHAAPASQTDRQRPRVEIHSHQAVLLERVATGGAHSLAAYGGYEALGRALNMERRDILSEITQSGLRGRGGAGFPTGQKWQAVAAQPHPVKYIVANADEGDAGAYIDRLLMEDDPHALIEAMLIAAYAVGASQGYIYLRKEYPQAGASLRAALDEAREAGLLGEDILGSELSFDIQLIMGQGSYLCGEETALLNAIEGRRPEVRARPPYPTQHGLFGKPTLVNNVETLANIPWIVLHGGAAYQTLGVANSRGNKLISMNSLFRRPGLYEIEFGMPLRQIVNDIGGGLSSGELKGLIIGGPLAGVIPPQLLDTAFDHEALHAIGAAVGHGGIIAFDENTSIPALMHQVFEFGAYESCGKCTPCRLGSREIAQMLQGILAGQPAAGVDWREIISALAHTSLCGHGAGMAEFARSIERHYTGELDTCFV